MISFQCPGCARPIKVNAALGGKKGKCPGCGQPVTVPRAAGSAAADDRTLPPISGVRRAEPPCDDTFSGSAKDVGDHPAELTDFLAPPQAPEEIGRLGTYRVLAVLGAGGMGVVFRAEDTQLERLVALKAMLPSLAVSASARQRFLREAKTAAAVEHDHIVPIFQVGEDRGVPFIAMPFLQGEPLDVRLQREQRLPLAEVLRIGRQTAVGLAAAHKKGLIHRDIKPANIWLEAETGRVKILDFGLARAAADNAQLTQQGALVGTPAYMAPEQAQGQSIDARCDLFSLGCMLYRLATGQAPFKGTDPISTLLSVASDQPTELRLLNADLPAEFSRLVLQLLSKKPEHRPESAQAVVQALEAIEAQTASAKPKAAEHRVRPAQAARARHEPAPTVAGIPKAARRPKKKKSSRWPLLVGSGVGLAGAVIAVLLLFWQRPHNTVKTESDVQNGKVTVPGDSPLANTFTNSLGMEFVLVPRGKSWLGGGSGKLGDKEVEISQDFYLGKYEVTQEEWQKVTDKNPSFFSRTGIYDGKDKVKDVSDADLKRFPVEFVRWDDTQSFLVQLNAREKKAGWVYRLPTEAEWEYACRGGAMKDKSESGFDFYFDKPTNQLLPEQANNGPKATRPCKVGSYQPNRLGLYDMHGNVWEWCNDARQDPKGAAFRPLRGGSWGSGCTATAAWGWPPAHISMDFVGIGFRVARVPVVKEGNKGATARSASEWAQSIGDRSVWVRVGDKEQEVAAARNLPTAEFHLTRVDFWGNQKVTDAELAHLEGLTTLTFVNIGQTPVSDAGVAHLKGLSNLTSLCLRGTRVTDAGLEHLKELTNLTHLDLTGLPVNGSGFVHLKGLTNLAFLNLWNCPQVSGDGLEHLPQGLRTLSLNGTRVDGAGVARLEGLTRLVDLDLGGSLVDGAGLAHLKELTTLTRLHLGGCSKVSGPRLELLKGLTFLDLQQTPMDDAGLKALTGLNSLTELNLTGTQATAEGVAALQKALPKCRIAFQPAAK
jgi:serine/threonine protein kinase